MDIVFGTIGARGYALHQLVEKKVDGRHTAHSAVIDQRINQLATKTDLAAVDNRITHLELRLLQDAETTRRWLTGVMIAAVGAIIAAVKLLPGLAG